jgi:hypothetical protein
VNVIWVKGFSFFMLCGDKVASAWAMRARRLSGWGLALGVCISMCGLEASSERPAPVSVQSRIRIRHRSGPRSWQSTSMLREVERVRERFCGAFGKMVSARAALYGEQGGAVGTPFRSAK